MSRTKAPAKSQTTDNKTTQGLRIPRVFTQAGQSPFDQFKYDYRSSVIRNPSGDSVFEMHDVEVPEGWSQVATDILAQKYFRKAGVPLPDGTTGSESSAKQVMHRLAHTWRVWGERNGYFASTEDAQAFYDELVYMLLDQRAAPNSPQWFNTGLYEVYGIDGPPQGHYYVEPSTGVLTPSESAYKRPQPHACARGNTRLFTNQGIRTIAEVVNEKRTDLQVWDGTRMVPVLAVKNNGTRAVYRATLRNGNFIEFTDDHQIYASPLRRKDGGQYAWHPLRAILGMKVLQSVPVMASVAVTQPTTLGIAPTLADDGLNPIAATPDALALAKAELAGWIVGDGYYGRYASNPGSPYETTQMGVITINDDEFAHVTQLFETVFGQYKVVRKPEIGPDYRIVKYDYRAADAFAEAYMLGLGTAEAAVPEPIWQGSPAEQTAFLRSLFQADGTVRMRTNNGRNAGDIVLSTISEELAHGVQLLLLSLGIYSNVSRGVDSRPNRKPLYQVTIAYESERKKFADQIGFISAEKQAKLAELNASVAGKSKLAESEESVVRIDYIGEETVYDIQTKTGRFSANGVTVHNCFILSVEDDLVGEGGIMDLWVREARIFKYGSGVGTNFSNMRAEGEKLSGGGHSSGLMSFLKIGDRAAGAIKSGGTTRRAAKMVVLDLDHPEIMDFINWKVKEEDKVAALIAAGYASDYEGEAYLTVSGQNSNNSVRIPNEFFEALATGGDWQTTARTTGQVMKTYKAQAIWDAIAQAAWRCADPGLQYHTTINQWHTCPVDGPIRASNPCSEYMFLDNTACNLASVNLRKFFDLQTCTLDVEGYRHACRLWTIVLEISVLMAHFPSKEIAQLSYEFRTLGLGYANLGSVLMVAGIPYDSPEATAICGAITALMTGTSYATSAEMAEILGPFSGYERNKEHMLRVMRNHRLAAYNAPKSDYDNLTVTPVGIDPKYCPDYLLRAATSAWDDALQRGEQHGYRNAQTTVLAPTGTIGLLMDCDTTGVEPDFALVKFKKLAGGGYFKIINQSIPPAMANLGYNELQQKAIYAYVMGHATLDGAPYINPASLKAKGLTDQDIQKLNAALGSAFQIDFAFNQWTLGEETLQRLGFKPEQYNAAGFNLLRAMGYSRAEIEAANEYVCGTQTIEGAPHLRPEHYPVFDCANKCGTKGTRFIHPHGHIRMMAAAQPFISGAISKTINFPHETQWEEVQDSYKISWELGLKALSIYRDGSKLSQPLSTKSDVKDDDAVADALVTANAVATAETEAQAQALLAEAQAKLAKAEQEVQELLALSQEKLLERVRKLIATPEGTELQRELRRLVSRRPMPSKRYGFTQKASVGGQAIYVRTGEYEDGTLGELFIDMHKEGATMRSLMNSFAIAVSIGLQYGVPLEEFVDKFSFTRFEPAGPVADHPNIKYATSLVDYIFRLLAFEYLNREDLVQVKPSDLKPASPTATEHYQQHAALANAPTEAEPEAAAKKKTSRTIGVIPRVVGDIGENGEALADEPTITNSDSGNPVPRLRVVTRSAGLAPQTQSAIAGVSTLSAAASLAANPGLAPQISADAAQRSVEATQEFLGNLMGDAPACNVCGHITIRNGTCYRCLNCGNSMGCS